MKANRPLFALVILCAFPSVARATEYQVSSTADILDKLQNAAPGDIIRVAPGTYAFDDKIRLNKTGTAGMPVVLTADGKVGSVIFDTQGPEGFYIPGTDYTIDKIWLRCQGAGCTDAAGFSLKETARRITVQHCITTDFYQHYKGSMSGGVGAEDVTIQGSEAYNTASFNGSTNAINLDGGKRWRVIGNYVHDYGNAGISYGIYFKGGTTESVMEKNLVVASHDRPSTGDAVLGLSFGGGRMGKQYCAADNVGSGGCRCEDFGGIARNNIVVGCNDSALHVNSGCGSKFLNNIVDSPSTTLQIQSFEGQGAIVVRNNVVSGNIPASNVEASDNLVGVSAAQFAAYYKDPTTLDFSAGAQSNMLGGAPPLADVKDDYCGTVRGSTPSRGAIEMPAACATWPWLGTATAGTSTSSSSSGQPTSGTGAGGGTASSGTEGSSSGAGGANGDTHSGESGGCSMSRESPRSLGWLVGAFGLGALLLRRRRQA